MEKSYSSMVESEIKSRLNSREGLKLLLNKYKGIPLMDAILNEKFNMYSRTTL